MQVCVNFKTHLTKTKNHERTQTDLKSLDSKKTYKLSAPFLPAPLIDKASSLNFRHWVAKEDDGSFSIYFTNH